MTPHPRTPPSPPATPAPGHVAEGRPHPWGTPDGAPAAPAPDTASTHSDAARGHPDPAEPCAHGEEGAVRLTWAQPEDLIGHELRQAAEDGRDPEPYRRAWLAAGGEPAPDRAGASPVPAPPALRALAERLLTELDAVPSPWSDAEPLALDAIAAACGTRAEGFSPSPPVTGARPPAPGPPGPARAPHGTQPDGTHTPPEPAAPTPPPDGAARTPAEPVATGSGAPAPGRAGGTGPGGSRRGEGLRRRLEAAWVGRAVGCLLGKPVEKVSLDGIRALARATGNWPLDDWFTARGVPAATLAAHPWNRRSAATSLAENIDGMPEDDDLNYPLLNLLLLQRHGKDFRTADVARLWLDELPAGRTFTAERVAYRNLLLGLEPPHTATHHNPFREWIGALIRADVHGWTNPGHPWRAAAQAYRDATLTHTANGVYAAMFTAAALAGAATGTADVHAALRAGLAVVPPASRLAEAVTYGIRAATAADPAPAGFDHVVDALHHRYGHYHWVHAVPNTALIAAALTHADGDFTHSVCRAVSGGWDTDSNGATAGSLAGLLAGAPENLPARWTTPLKNRLATTVPGFDGIGFDTLAHLTAQEAAPS